MTDEEKASVLVVVLVLLIVMVLYVGIHHTKREAERAHQQTSVKKIGKGKPVCMWNLEDGGTLMEACEEPKISNSTSTIITCTAGGCTQ
jgi:hypothetical protein